MVVDTSALVAILNGEPESGAFLKAIVDADDALMGAPTKFELMLVMGGYDDLAGVEDAQALLRRARIQVVDWTDDLAERATSAFLQYGRRRHQAKLNFGDCMSYALAKSLDAPLLYKGNDFAQTDIRAAV